MFESRLVQGNLFKKIVDAMKDLVTQANFDCSGTGINLQAMDNSHVALVSLQLRHDGFEHFRCDRTLALGIKMESMAKILKCAGSNDIITLKAEDAADTLTFMFESETQDKISDFELKLMSIDSEHLGIPDTEYTATIKMPSAEFQRITRDLQIVGDTVKIAVTKDGIKFSVSGDLGSGNTMIRQSAGVDKPEDAVTIDLQEPCAQSFAIKYLESFCKATPLSSTVTLKMHDESPLVVEYEVGDMGYIRYYLAPKIDDEE